MGQKVNPLGIRLGITRDWVSKWYAGKRQFPILVHTDFRVRQFLKKKLSEASVSRVLPKPPSCWGWRSSTCA
jgi:small subunit ribosomal protein S3